MKYLLKLLRAEIRAIVALIQGHRIECVLLIVPLTALLIILNPFTDKKIILAADNEGSSWYAMAQKSEKYLKELGIQYQVHTSDGTIKNAELLADPNGQVNAAFLIPGALDASTNKKFFSLGSLDYEPIWIFYNHKKLGQIDSLRELAKYKIGVGPLKSGRYTLTRKLFALNHVELDNNPNFSSDTLDRQIAKMKSGEIDGLIFIGEAFDKNVAKLLHEPDVAIFEFTDIAAYEKNISYLDVVKIPASSIDIINKLPAKDILLTAITTTLAVRKDTHPGLQLALLLSAKEVDRNSQSLFFSKRNEFPAYVDPQIELSPVAKQYYDLGPSAAMRYLPFWLAVFVERFWVLLVMVFAVLYPLVAYNFGAQTFRRNQVYALHYDELIKIEKALSVSLPTDQTIIDLDDRLQRIEKALRDDEVVRMDTKLKHFNVLLDAAEIRKKIDRLLSVRGLRRMEQSANNVS